MTIGKRAWGWLAILAVSALLGWCATHDDTPDYRYRLTVEVETPQGLRTGSSVIEVQTAVSHGIPTPGAMGHRVRGEAVAVDLPGGRTLFALLRSENDIDWASRVMFMLAADPPKSVSDRFEARFDEMLKLKGPIVLPHMWPPVGDLAERSAYPMLVTFSDLSDPTSVTRVDPDNVAASFGEGVRVKRITVQMTDDPVSAEIRKRLRWLKEIHPGKLNGDRFEVFAKPELAAHLSASSFSTEIGTADR